MTNNNPIDSSTFFMLMVELEPKKCPYTFFTMSFHYQHFLDEEPMEAGKVEEARLAVFTHPRKEEEVDYIFPWIFDHEKSVMSPRVMRRLRSKHVFWDALILHRRDKQLLRLTWK